MITVRSGEQFAHWRQEARNLLVRNISPERVDWLPDENQQALFDLDHGEVLPPGSIRHPGPVKLEDPPIRVPEPEGVTSPGERAPAAAAADGWKVPRRFLELASTAWAHPDPRKAAVLYRILWRMTLREEKHLLDIPTDPDMHRVAQWVKAVRRDIHKMHAFVRFRKVATDEETGREKFAAWYEPSTRCVRMASPFFRKRFAGMDWSILTPDECVHWDGQNMTFSPGIPKPAKGGEEVLDDLWRTYYRSIFNPARLKVKAMQSEMPVKFWKNLPEAPLIPGLIAGSQERTRQMLETVEREASPVPRNDYMQELHQLQKKETVSEIPELAEDLSWESLREGILGCRACPLWQHATQSVPGTGPALARIMIVGEQPGDQEDLAGQPFVGPAGQILRNAMTMAGLDPAEVYLTNAVKHFKWTPDGRRRKHLSPNREEVQHCRPWVLAELHKIQPRVLVLLGSTAATSLLNRPVQVTKERGIIEAPHLAPTVILTYHPSYLLRLRSGPVLEQTRAGFEGDLQMAASAA